MAEMAPSSDSAVVDEPTITIDGLKELSGFVAVPSTSAEVLLELQRQGFTIEEDGNGVVLLAPPGGRCAGYMIGRHDLVRKSSVPTGVYPTGAKTGEYAKLPPVMVGSGHIEEDHDPRNSPPETVQAYVKLLPSIVRHEDGSSSLRISLDTFHFASHGMVNKPDEKGYFIHTATIKVTPEWLDPSFKAQVWPATKPRQAVISTARERNVGATIGVAPTLDVGGGRTRGQEMTIEQWDWGVIITSDLSTAAWKWQMRTWEDFTPFNHTKPQLYRVGSVPELPYDVTNGIAGLSITDDPDTSRHTEAEWQVPTTLVTGNVGQLEVEIEITLDLEIVASKSFALYFKNKVLRVDNRLNPGFKTVNMSGKFAF